MICVDGGHIRERLKKRGKRKKGQKRQGYHTDWFEPRLLTISQFDENGKKIKSISPILDGSCGSLDDFFGLLKEYLSWINLDEASEILSLSDEASRTKGVDAIHSVEEAAEAASILAKELGTTVVITGEVDLITDGNRTCRVLNRHQLMGFVTGTGCTATAIIGVFLAVDNDPVEAAATALAFFGLAGEKAGKSAQAPSTFQIALLDALFTITPETLETGARIS